MSAESAARPKLLLIDGYHTIFRAFFAIRELANSKGLPTNAIYGFLQILRKVLRDEQPALVGIAFDVSDKTVRSERFADYKANRAPMPDELRVQIPHIRKVVEAFRIPILELENFEADDVMGTLSRKAAAAGYEVVLVSADKDLLQLVAPNVSMFHTGRNKRYDPALVEADYGLPPARIADYLALLGDTVDNVPGVPGIGEVSAKKLLQEFGSVEALLDGIDRIAAKRAREALAAHAEQARLSKELTTIHCDLPIELHEESLRMSEPDTEALRGLYAELEFRTLLEELGSVRAGEPARSVAEVADAGAWRAAAPALGKWLAVTLLVNDRPVALAAAGAPEALPLLADLRREELAAAVRETLAGWLADPEVELVGHDVKELLRLAGIGTSRAAVRARLQDLMLASYLLRSSAHGHTLEEIAIERLARQPRTAKEAGFDKGQEPPIGDLRLADLAAERLDLLTKLSALLFTELEATGRSARVYREIEAPLPRVLVKMEEAGILLDLPYLARMSAEMAEDIGRLEAEIHELAGERFNLNSPSQLGVILFEKLKLPTLRKTRKTKSWSTDAETLEGLAQQGHELPQRLLRYRELAKLKGTYVDALPQLADAAGRVHTRYHQAVAATGRLSSQNPNLQNIPVRTDLGQKIRKGFRAAAGKLLLVADYSQIELRILAHIAREPAMIEAFAQGEDIHRATAASVLGIAPELVSADQRRAAKAINFGLIYGQGAFGLAQTLGITTKEAERFIAAYFGRYAGIRAYMDETLAMAERDGRVETLFGRIRLLPELGSAHWNLRENARRVAINSRIQGTAADLLKLAMLAVDRRLEAEHPDARLLLTVHDEMVVEVPEGEVEAVGLLVRTEMEGAAKLDVPLVAEAGWGPTWYDAKG
jgi:DNA polymerase-1